MINARIRAGWDRVMRPVGQVFGKTRIHPNAITVIGLLVQITVAWLIVDGRLLAAGLVATLAGLVDTLDGAVAKARGMTSRFGAFLDSSTDRASDALIFLPIAWLYGVDPDIAERGDEWVALLAMGTLVFSFMVSYVKARAEGLGFDCNVGIAERAERLILVIAGLILDLVPLMLGILLALSIVTLVQRMVHVYRQSRSAP